MAPNNSPDPSRRLLKWYDRAGRDLPWRVRGGNRPDPYGVWLSEIMLQQTTVAAAAGYYRRFLARWPTVRDLARADLDQVLHAWQGLGYYARARNLHKCARQVAAERGGRFPETETELLELPGIGPYTAAAIAAIAFGHRAAPVDANVGRVLARVFVLADPMPKARRVIAERLAPMVPKGRPGDFIQALMDLGATVCTPRAPDCPACPWAEHCQARAQGAPESYPQAALRKAKPVRHGIAFWVAREDGQVLLRRRAEKGLLGGMMEFPSTEWRSGDWSWEEARPLAPAPGVRWLLLPGQVRHTFTHFQLCLSVARGRVNGRPPKGVWCPPGRLDRHALPTVMKKVARHVMAADTKNTGEPGAGSCSSSGRQGAIKPR